MQEFLLHLVDVIGSVQSALPGALAVLFFFVMRWPVRARRRVRLAVEPARAFAAVDFQSPDQAWHQPPTLIELIDETQQIYRATYWSSPASGGGQPHKTVAQWRIAERVPPSRLRIDRQGIESSKTAGELMQIEIDVAPAPGGSEIAMTYHWGPRPVIAQFLARVDLGATLKRIKSMVETGKADPRRERRTALTVGAATAVATLVGLGVLFGWRFAAILIGVLAVHEFGHLLAFRLVGQPWGRIVFIPFIGAIAMPRQHFRSLGEYAFASLMGPAFSLVLLVPVLFAGGGDVGRAILDIAMVACFINLLNLVPMMPFDGGHIVKAVCQSLGAHWVMPVLIFISVLIFVLAALSKVPLLIAPALAALLGMKEMAVPLSGMAPLDRRGIAAAVAGFVVVAGLYLWAILVLGSNLGLIG